MKKNILRAIIAVALLASSAAIAANEDMVVAQSKANLERRVYNNSFNPSIGIILNGTYQSFSSATSEIKGFGVGEEGERGSEGMSIGESELNFSANIDDKFKGSLTAAIVREDGEDKIELEEAYIETLGGVMPAGLNIKAGRSLWAFGYLNEHHAHSDDFADRPLPYRVYLNSAFNDDGVQFNMVLPTDIYAEIGGGIFRGDDFPGGGADGDGASAYSLFARIGGDIGANQSWRLGVSGLISDSSVRSSNEGSVTFAGDSNLYALDARYIYAPTGNGKEKELILQGEYLYRTEKGTYNDTGAGTGNVSFDDNTSGWYAQAVYKFQPEWRVGARVSQMNAADTPAGLIGSALDSQGHDPIAYSAMLDWTNSEFGRLRLQVNHEELYGGNDDTQVILQYSMSLGAHGAHAY